MSGRGNTPAAGVSGDMTLGVHQGDLAGLVFLVLLEEDFQGLRCVPSLSQEGQPFRPIVSVGERLGGDGSYPCLSPGYSRSDREVVRLHGNTHLPRVGVSRHDGICVDERIDDAGRCCKHSYPSYLCSFNTSYPWSF